MKKIAQLLGMTLLTTLALTACSKEEEVVATAPSTTTSFTGISVGTTTTAPVVTVTPEVIEEVLEEEEIDVMSEATPEYHVVETFDTTGTVASATVTHFPEKVVFLDHVAIDMVIAWGLTDKFNALVLEGDMPSYLENSPLVGAEYLETNPLEGDVLPLMEFAPDVIFANEESDIMFDTLSMIAPTLTYNMKMPTTYESFLAVARRNAELFGTEIVNINEDILSGFNVRKEKIQAYGETQTAVVLMLTEDGLVPLGADSDACSMIFSDFGFTNLAANFDKTEGGFTFFDLLTLDPDCVFFLNADENTETATFLNDKDLQSCNAWINDKVVILDGDIWTMMEGGILSMDIMLRDIENGFGDALSEFVTESSSNDEEKENVETIAEEVSENTETATDSEKSETDTGIDSDSVKEEVKTEEEEKSTSDETIENETENGVKEESKIEDEKIPEVQAEEVSADSESEEGQEEKDVAQLQSKVTDLESKLAHLEEMLGKLESNMST